MAGGSVWGAAAGVESATGLAKASVKEMVTAVVTATELDPAMAWATESVEGTELDPVPAAVSSPSEYCQGLSWSLSRYRLPTSPDLLSLSMWSKFS